MTDREERCAHLDKCLRHSRISVTRVPVLQRGCQIVDISFRDVVGVEVILKGDV